MLSYRDVIEKFKLEPLAQEGGYFRRIYESERRDERGRAYAASILYLLNDREFSCFHRIDCDEVWHFYSGVSLVIHQIKVSGELISTKIGNPVTDHDAVPNVCVDKGDWFAAEVLDGQGFSLAGCTTIPEFTYQGFEAAKRHDLISLYPQHQDLITRLTRE